MEKAYHCPRCGADTILDGTSELKCVFCSSPLSKKDMLARPKGGFYVRDLTSVKHVSYTCAQCGRNMYLPSGGTEIPGSCVFCGNGELTKSAEGTALLSGGERMPFRFDRKEAQREYTDAVRKDKKRFRSFGRQEYLDAITPVYVPFFFFDYHIFARTILSVVPYVKQPRNLGDKILGVILLNDFTLERSSSVITPYPKNMNGEMAWKNIPISASPMISMPRLDEISPFPMNSQYSSGNGKIGQAVILGCDSSSSEIRETFLRRIREFVKECMIVENLESFAISSYVDDTEYEDPIGQLVYIPLWVMKKRKKNQCLTWYMNALSGESSPLSWESTEPQVVEEVPQTLETMKKKRIKNFSSEDFGGTDRKINYRTYMIDIVASSIAAEMTLNEMSTDKSLIQLERQMRRQKLTVNVPLSEAFQGDAEIVARESKNTALPSRPVPLPTKHSPLYLMKEEAMENSLGSGVRLPERILDRRVGNEDLFDEPETAEHVAVDKGLADLPEYDPSGPDPFKH